MRGFIVRSIVCSLAASACAVVGVVAPSSTLAAYPGANGRIAYSGHPGSGLAPYNIFSVLPDGSVQRRLTMSATDESDPSWSADGRRLAFVRGDHIFKMTDGGGAETKVTRGRAIDSSPAFTPGGGRIVFSRDNLPIAGPGHPRRVSIMMTDAAGGNTKRLVTGFIRAPAIAPSGKRIVFEGIPKGKPKMSYGLWTIRRDGSDLQRLTHPGASVYDETPDWSPNGRDVVFLRCGTDSSTHGCVGSLEVVAADGADRHPIRAVVGEAYPAYAPNGARIALTSGSDTCSGIFTVNTAGGEPHEVTHYCDPPAHGGFASAPSWQPLP